MSIKHVGVQEAHDLQATDGYTYVDVRSVPEYENGHPEGAHNVPLLHRDSQTGQMTPNPDFLAVMQANYGSDAKLLIGCQVGGRSFRAAQILSAAGLRHRHQRQGRVRRFPRPRHRPGGRRRLGSEGTAGREREPAGCWLRRATSERWRHGRLAGP